MVLEVSVGVWQEKNRSNPDPKGRCCLNLFSSCIKSLRYNPDPPAEKAETCAGENFVHMFRFHR